MLCRFFNFRPSWALVLAPASEASPFDILRESALALSGPLATQVAASLGRLCAPLGAAAAPGPVVVVVSLRTASRRGFLKIQEATCSIFLNETVQFYYFFPKKYPKIRAATFVPKHVQAFKDMLSSNIRCGGDSAIKRC